MLNHLLRASHMYFCIVLKSLSFSLLVDSATVAKSAIIRCDAVRLSACIRADHIIMMFSRGGGRKYIVGGQSSNNLRA